MTRLEIRHNDEDCVGDGLCCEHAPRTFVIEGRVAKVTGDWDAEEDVLAAAMDCRNDCINLRDGETGEVKWPRSASAGPLSAAERAGVDESRQVTLDRGPWAAWRDLGGGD